VLRCVLARRTQRLVFGFGWHGVGVDAVIPLGGCETCLVARRSLLAFAFQRSNRGCVTSRCGDVFGSDAGFPEVGVGRPKADAPVIAPWLANVRAMAADLLAHRELADVPSAVQQADSRDFGLALDPASVDSVITSPPYPNEKDYTRTTRLESVLLGFVNSRSELRALKAGKQYHELDKNI